MTEQSERKQKEEQKTDNSGNKSALYSLSIEQVVGSMDSGRFTSIFHESETGKNTSISNGLFHCWMHNVSHTPLTALAVMAGMFKMH